MNTRELSPEEKEHMRTATRVTVGTISQIEDRGIKVSYVPRIRGRFVCKDINNYKYATPEEARKAGKEILAGWKSAPAEGGSDDN